MDYATTLHGHPATVHTKIIRNFPVVGHFEYGDVRLFANLQRSDAFFPPQRIGRIERRRRNGLRRRSEEHTSELQSQSNLVCRLLLEKKKHKALSPLTST